MNVDHGSMTIHGAEDLPNRSRTREIFEKVPQRNMVTNYIYIYIYIYIHILNNRAFSISDCPIVKYCVYVYIYIYIVTCIWVYIVPSGNIGEITSAEASPEELTLITIKRLHGEIGFLYKQARYIYPHIPHFCL